VTRFAEHTDPPARRSDQGLVALAAVAGVLLAWGAFALLPFIEDDDLTGFWIRLAVGIGVAIATFWATSEQHWLLATFLALAWCITPVAHGWAWAQVLYIVLAVWAFVRFIANIMTGRDG